MPSDSEFKQALEQIKLRLPIEDVVRERVADLRRAGALWVACCPFHEEKTPSFKVDPRRGSWRCYGACATGGDQISFVERSYGVEFMEAVRILADRAGVSLPERERGRRRNKEQDDPLYAVLERAQSFFTRELHGAEGARALEYLRSRGLLPATLEAFGVGYAPASGGRLVSQAARRGIAIDALVESGLARRYDDGNVRDFFRGRLMIPVRDLRGRTVGFGGRRLEDREDSPKYINTPETPLFHKGRLIYGLDRALAAVRRGGHLVLVEGYTDVMAAHQVGLGFVAAVLGTATTEEHAGLVRRSGARRVSLVFDGDEAGRQATLRGLYGLLPLGCEVDVVRLAGGEDPCDLLVRGGAAPFEAALAAAAPWFEHLLESVLARPSGPERWKAIDELLELVARLPKPLQRDERLQQLAGVLGSPVEGVREQFESLPERRRERRLKARRARDEAERAEGPAPTPEIEPRERAAYEQLIGAALLDPAYAPRLAPYVGEAPGPEHRRLMEVLVELASQGGGGVEGCTPDALLAALAADGARRLVVPLLEKAECAEGARSLFEGGSRFLDERRRRSDLRAGLARLAAADDVQAKQALEALHRSLREQFTGS